MIVLPLRFRVVLIVTTLVILAMIYFIYLNSKSKIEYQKITGHITYIDKQFGSLPTRDLGKYRYLRLDSYPYIFEVYADEQSAKIDKLNLQDSVTAYFYETNNTKAEQINRFLQFLDKGNEEIFKKTGLNIVTGLIVIVLSILISILSYVLYKKGKIAY